MNERLAQREMLIDPASVGWVDNLTSTARLLSEDVLRSGMMLSNPTFEWDERMSRYQPYYVDNGTLTVPVKGVLWDDFDYQFGDMVTGYNYIVAATERGMADPAVREIVFDVDSPGGDARGCFECVDAIHALRGRKPMTAHANDFAYSGAYAVASAADEIVMGRLGGVGSIGVVTAHSSISGALEQRGIEVTLVYAGKRKVDGHPAIQLSEPAKAEMQERIDAIYGIFVSTVARNRGLEEDAVRATEAGVFMAAQAIDLGLADRQADVGSPSASADPLEHDEDEEMSHDSTSTVAQAVTQADLDKAVSDAVTAERARINSILSSDAAEKRPALATKIALTTAMTSEEATAILEAAAEEVVEAAPATTEEPKEEGASLFERGMSSDNPEVGAGAGDDTTDPNKDDDAFLAAFYGDERPSLAAKK